MTFPCYSPVWFSFLRVCWDHKQSKGKKKNLSFVALMYIKCLHYLLEYSLYEIGSTMRNELKDGKKEKEKLPTIGYAKKR